jgi:hypothetical protein
MMVMSLQFLWILLDVWSILSTLPTAEEITLLKQYCKTQGDAPWNPPSFSNQMADKFYQHETENYNTCSNSNSKSCPLNVDQHNPLIYLSMTHLIHG